MVLVESGYSMNGSDNVASEGLLDGLPIRGGERVDISIEDNYGNTLTLKDGMYVNRVRMLNQEHKMMCLCWTCVLKSILLTNRPE